MAKDTYEISVWRDVLVNGHYEEAKIAVIGSDKLKASCRAIEPKLIENINGTNTFTFKMLSRNSSESMSIKISERSKVIIC